MYLSLMQIRRAERKFNMLIRVKNLIGTSDNLPPYGYQSWKDYWIAAKGYWPSTCAISNCFEKAEVGAHVKIVGSADNRWFIVPLCSGHNHFDGEFYVEDYMLVPVRR